MPKPTSASNSSDNVASGMKADSILTVLIFKDASTPRTFRVPLRWIHQFGWILLALTLTALLSLAAVVELSFHRTAPSVNSSTPRVVSTPEVKATPVQTATPAATESSLPVIDPSLISPSSPITTRPFLFRGLPQQIQPPPANASPIPIKIVAPQAHWSGKILNVSFALQYIAPDAGNQQGRIIVLARGPSALLAHPQRVLQSSDKDFLINPNQGEFFSVSRFREAKASFGPLPSQDWITEVEILIIGSGGQLLLHDQVKPSNAPSSDSPESKGE